MSRDLVKALRSRGVDLLTAREAGLVHIPDHRHLEHAVALERIVFTHNTRDFVKLHMEYLSAGRHHAGIIVSDQLQVGVLMRRLLKLMSARSASDLRDRLEYLSNWR